MDTKPLLEQMLKLVESLSIDGYVNPAEAFLGPGGEMWNPIGASGVFQSREALPYRTDSELTAIRNRSRLLALINEYAIAAIDNRINYIVGPGHTYTAVAKRNEEPGDELIQQVQDVVDDFVKVNKWHKRQQENQRRGDRDGEVFLRFFTETGKLVVRYIEPGQVSTPSGHPDKDHQFGVESTPDDVEDVIAYWVDGKRIEAAEIQHRKRNVDMTCKRGLPTLFAVGANLGRVEKVTRNMATVTEIQSAIAMIRKHMNQSRAGIEAFTAGKADVTHTDTITGRTQTAQRFAPGTILDVNEGIEYEFPTMKVDPSKPVGVIQAILRAVAARLVMPEYMLTADASNANYASTLVAEAPAVKGFGREQATMIEEDQEVIGRAIDVAVINGRLAEGVLDMVEIQVQAPTLVVRDELKETQKHQIENTSEVLSKQTWAAKAGLDYEQEQANLDADPAIRASGEPFGIGQQRSSGDNNEGLED